LKVIDVIFRILNLFLVSFYGAKSLGVFLGVAIGVLTGVFTGVLTGVLFASSYLEGVGPSFSSISSKLSSNGLNLSYTFASLLVGVLVKLFLISSFYLFIVDLKSSSSTANAVY